MEASTFSLSSSRLLVIVDDMEADSITRTTGSIRLGLKCEHPRAYSTAECVSAKKLTHVNVVEG